MISTHNDSEIILRWAPKDYASWQRGLQEGYKLERVTIRRAGSYIPPEKIELGIIKLAPLSAWQPYYTENDMVATAAEAIFSENIATNNTMLQNLNDQNLRLSLQLMTADFDPLAAELSGLRFADYDVLAGEEYVYRLTFATNSDTAWTVESLDRTITRPEAPMAVIKSNGPLVDIKWRSVSGFTGYYVEKKRDNNFIRLHTVPKIPGKPNETIHFKDSVMLNTPQIYRIVGIDAFAEPFYSDTITITPHRELTYRPVSLSFTPANENTLVRWNLPGIEEKAFISSLYISFSQYQDGPYKNISNNLIDRDSLLISGYSGYFRLECEDIYGNDYTSFPYLHQVADTIAPLPPVISSYTIESSSVLTIQWQQENATQFRIYKSNNKEGPFTQVPSSRIESTRFQDTLKTGHLNRFAYYYITALDAWYNESEPSDTMEIELPDIIPPPAPSLTSYENTGNSLRFHFSYPTHPDIHAFHFFSGSISQPDSLILVAVPDDTYEISHDGYIWISASDKAGNKSQALGPFECRKTMKEITLTSPVVSENEIIIQVEAADYVKHYEIYFKIDERWVRRASGLVENGNIIVKKPANTNGCELIVALLDDEYMNIFTSPVTTVVW